MSVQKFLESTVKNIKLEHARLLKTPRARASEDLKQNILEFLDYCGFLLRGGKLLKVIMTKL